MRTKSASVNQNHDRILKQWESYRQAVLEPVHAGAIQTEECRRAFYAGAHGMYQIQLQEIAVLPEVAAELAMRGLEVEIARYVRSVKERG